MKRWIHASTSDTLKNIQEAKKELQSYTDEQIQYVKDCQDEISKAISDNYAREDEGLDPVGPKLSEIKRDYMVGAIEDDLMTEEEFEDIFDLLDVIAIELSQPYA